MSAELKVAVFVIMVTSGICPATGSQDCPHWKAIVQSPRFQRCVLAATKSDRLDIGVPKSFDEDDVRLLNEFLMKTRISVRSFTFDNGFCSDYTCMRVRNDRRALLLVICRSSLWKVLWDASSNPYVAYLCVVAANYRNVTNPIQHSLMRHYTTRIHGSGVFNFTVNRGELLVTVNNEDLCLDYSEVPDAPQTLNEDLPLAGADVRVRCLYPYICEDPAFEMLGEVVRRKNASFRAFEFGMNGSSIYIAASETHLYPAAMMYFPTFLLLGSLFPGTMVPCYYSESGYSFFVSALKPYRKEMVLVLPFSLPVWLISMSCFVTCLLMTRLIRGILGGSSKSAPVHPFVRTLMYQSFSISTGSSRYISFRLLLGVWIIATFVMTVGFRSQLTSFLNDVPLEGKAVVFTSLEDLRSLGFRVCVLSYAEEVVVPGMSVDPDVQVGKVCFDSFGRIRIGGDGKDTFLVYGSGSRKHEVLKRQLISRGYIQTNTKVMAYTGGLEIRTTSPYRKAIGKLLSQSFQGGLFDHAVRRAVLKYPSHRDADRTSPVTVEEPLTVSSFRPYFFLWALGIIISSSVFVAEYLADCFNRRKRCVGRSQPKAGSMIQRFRSNEDREVADHLRGLCSGRVVLAPRHWDTSTANEATSQSASLKA